MDCNGSRVLRLVSSVVRASDGVVAIATVCKNGADTFGLAWNVLEAAAREYFSREEKESEKKNKKSQKIGVSFKNKAEKKGGRSIRSSVSRSRKRSKKMRRGGGSITLSQASSILSSSSEYSLSSGDSSSSGTINELEMEAAMMDLELVKRSIAEKGYV